MRNGLILLINKISLSLRRYFLNDKVMLHFFKSIRRSVKHWYIPLILGILFILCGIGVIISPQDSYLTLSILFSLSFLVSGIIETFFALQNTKNLNGWGWYLVSGLISLIMGIFLLMYPALSMFILPLVVGFTLLFRSFQLLGFAFEEKEAGVLNWGNLAIVSVLSIILSFILIANPIFTGISLVVFTGLAFISTGISSVILSFNLKKLKGSAQKLSDDLKNRIEDLEKEVKEATK